MTIADTQPHVPMQSTKEIGDRLGQDGRPAALLYRSSVW